MTLTIKAEPVPLRQEGDGSVRVGGTRVLLDVVIASYQAGSSAEQIVDQYPALNLADVHAVISYYLKNTSTVDAYLTARRVEAAELRKEIEAKYGQEGIRERLLERYRAMPDSGE